MAPASNYGAGGALSVSGSVAVNGAGVQNGLFDTMMRFPMSNVVASLNKALSNEDWIVTRLRLVLTEMAASDNAMFNRGVGAFEVRWLVTDSWIEGTGTPKLPTSDGVTWQDLPGILNSNQDLSLGVFTNTGTNGQVSFTLETPASLQTDVHAGEAVSLYLTAQSPEVGFTFNSRDFGNTNAKPILQVSALAKPKPRIDYIELTGTNVSVRFATISNWTFRLQCTESISASATGIWSTLLALPAQPFTTNVVYTENLTNAQRFYRLSVSP